MIQPGSDLAGPSSAESAQVIDRLYDALSRGDADGARACVTDDVEVWHSFDGVVLGLRELLVAWRQLIGAYPRRSFVDVRRSPVPGGWVQRHLMVCRTAAGDDVAWPLCVFVTLRDGLILRLDEYIDRAGRFDGAGDTTPGLPPARQDTVL